MGLWNWDTPTSGVYPVCTVTPDLLKLDAIRNFFGQEVFQVDRYSMLIPKPCWLVGTIKGPTVSMIHQENWGIPSVMVVLVRRSLMSKFQERGVIE